LILLLLLLLLEAFAFARHSRERGNPETSNVLARKALDSRVRGNDGRREYAGLVVSIRCLRFLKKP
jgi:hypothetical protein